MHQDRVAPSCEKHSDLQVYSEYAPFGGAQTSPHAPLGDFSELRHVDGVAGLIKKLRIGLGMRGSLALFWLLSWVFTISTARAQEVAGGTAGEAEVKPVKALLILGGCCHDYEVQKQLIKRGLEQLAHIEVTVIHQGGTGTSAEIALYRDPKWADAYDVILHDECFSDDKDPAWLARILEPHRKGKPGVVIHCAMHCYRVGNDDWFEFCGVTSRGHGPHYPHEVRNVRAADPIMAGFGPAWANPAGELYRIEKFWPTATALATAKDRENGEDQVCVWTNDYRGTRVFGTTLGHHNETVEDPTFLKMLTRGTLWAAGRLDPKYLKPEAKRLVRENLALGKTVTASSEQKDQNNLLAYAVDGNRGTRWCASGGSFPQWLRVDLGEVKEVHGVGIDWEMPQGKYRYEVQASVDAESFQTVVSRKNGDGEAVKQGDSNVGEEIFESPIAARWIKVSIEGANPGAWASIRELRVFGGQTKEVSVEDSVSQRERELLGECKLPEGFDATLFAAPPAVNYPVFVAAAPDGTLFVSSDKNGSLDRELKRGSIVRLKDFDGDGRADQSNLYVDDVDSPRGLVWDHDRLYVLHPPHLSAFIDENGDGVSDRQEILVKDIAFGFKDRPADHTSNGVTMGIDGWLYLAIGDFGFMKGVGADGRELQFRGGGVVRVRPDGTGLELYSNGTRNILEVAMDPLLRGYARDNTNDGGGWDVRMHHFSGMDDHGYPRKYINFPEEIVPPLADYGGGSGCGALFLDEPGWPSELNDCIYTADWGRQQIFSHRVTPKGASVTVDQKEFLGIERATDLDVDAKSNVYAASWKGATFTYAGENVGYIVQLKPKGYVSEPLPVLDETQSEPWFDLLLSASHRRRIEGQRGLLRFAARFPDRLEDLADRLVKLANDENVNLKSRVGAVFTLELLREQWIQGRGSPEKSQSLWSRMIALCDTPSISAWAIRAAGDALVRETQLRSDKIVLSQTVCDRMLQGVESDDPRRVAEGLVALGRLGSLASLEFPSASRAKIAKVVSQKLGVEDPLLRHLATRALSEHSPWESAMTLLKTDSTSAIATEAATQALSIKHDMEVIDRAIAGLDQAKVTDSMAMVYLRVLSRLGWKEGEWNGASWGTRPDTRGPYYQPEKWEATEKIEQSISKWLKRCDAQSATEALRLLSLNRWSISDHLESWMTLPQWSELPFEERIKLIESAGKLPDSVIGKLIEVTRDPRVSGEQVLSLLNVASSQNSESALDWVAAIAKRAESLSMETLAEVWKRCHSSDALSKRVDSILKRFVSDPSMSNAITLTAIGTRKELAQRPEVLAAMDNLWKSPEMVLDLFSLFQAGTCKQAEPMVRRGLLDPRPEIEKQGKVLADAWGLADLNQWTGPKIGGLVKEEVLKQAVATKGDAKRGEQVFGLLGCAKCHDVTPSEALRGPYLPNVAKTYRRDQLVEAILMPSKSIAQGFVQNIFQLDDDSIVSGFVTKESPEKIILRNAQGEVVEVAPETISQRKESPQSVMPEGLADGIPVTALADLISYLESL